MSLTSAAAARSTWHPPSSTSSHPSAGVPVLGLLKLPAWDFLPGSFRSPSFVAFLEWGRELVTPPDPEFAFPWVSVEGTLFFRALCYQALTYSQFFTFLLKYWHGTCEPCDTFSGIEKEIMKKIVNLVFFLEKRMMLKAKAWMLFEINGMSR